MEPSKEMKSTTEVERIESNAKQRIHIHAKTIIAVAAVCLLFFAELIGIVGSGLLAQQTATLLGSPDQYIWFSTCITIVSLATVLPLSQAADFWGRKWIVVISSTGGIIGPIVISRAQNVGSAIVGFCFLAVAYGCQSLLYAIPSEVLHRRQRAYGQAAVNMSAGTGAVVGVLMGGTLLKDGHAENYRVYWYVAAAIFAVGVVGIIIGYNPPPRDLQTSLTHTEKLQRLDWIGIFLLTLGLALFAIALQWSGNPYGWTDAPVLAPFIIGMVLLFGFSLYEWRGRNDGILHHKLFGDWNLPLSILAVLTEGLAFFTTNAFFVYEVSVVYNVNTLNACIRLAVLFIASIVTAFLAGMYTTWTKQLREPLVLGFALLITFNALLSKLDRHTPVANSYGYAAIGGAGIGCILTNVMVAAQMATPGHMISVTTGIATAARVFGGTIGLAVNNAIFSNSLSSALPANIAAAVLPLGFSPQNLGGLIGALTSHNEQMLAQVPGITPQIIEAASNGLVDAYTISFRKAWIAAACFSAVGLIASCLLRNPKAQFDQHIDAPAEADLVVIQEEIESLKAERSDHIELAEPN